MAILVKGMEMPTGCISCDFCNPFVEEPYCRRLMKRVPKVTRLDNCPLIEVPEPHGRLIDASEKIKVQMYDEEHEDWFSEKMTIDDLLGKGWIDAEAPTIIPASGEGEA